MFILKSVFGIEQQKEEIKKEAEQINLLPGRILDMHKRQYYIQAEQDVIKSGIEKFQQQIQQLTKIRKEQASQNNMSGAKQTVDKLTRAIRNLEDLKTKEMNCRFQKTNIEIQLMEGMLEYEAQKADNFLSSMYKINQKMSTMDAKDVASSLEDTNKLIQTLSAKRQEEQLAQFYSNINTEDLEKKAKDEQANNGSIEGNNSIYASTVRKNTQQDLPITPIEIVRKPFSMQEKEFFVPFQRPGITRLGLSEKFSRQASAVPKPSSAGSIEMIQHRMN